MFGSTLDLWAMQCLVPGLPGGVIWPISYAASFILTNTLEFYGTGILLELAWVLGPLWSWALEDPTCTRFSVGPVGKNDPSMLLCCGKDILRKPQDYFNTNLFSLNIGSTFIQNIDIGSLWIFLLILISYSSTFAEEIAQLLKYFPFWHENLSFIPKNQYRTSHLWCCMCVIWEGRDGWTPGACWPTSPAHLVSFRPTKHLTDIPKILFVMTYILGRPSQIPYLHIPFLLP